MKTTKYIVSIALLTLVTLTYGQRSYLLERLLPEEGPIAQFVNERDGDKSRIEIWTHDLHNRISRKTTWEVYDNPVVTHSFYVKQVEVIYEEELGVEKWMTTPFETGLGEEEIRIEPWMTVPFETGTGEKDLSIESWMTEPFYGSLAEKPLAVETWMTVPFANPVADEEINVELWMTIPFEVDERLGMGECMADAGI